MKNTTSPLFCALVFTVIHGLPMLHADEEMERKLVREVAEEADAAATTIVCGRVVDEDNQPIPGADVELTESDEQKTDPFHQEQKADSEGYFLFSGVPVDHHLQLVGKAGALGKVPTFLKIAPKELLPAARPPRSIEADSIDDREIKIAELQLELARANANKLIEVEYAKAAWTVTIAEVEGIVQKNKEVANSVSDQEVLEAKLRKIQAQKQYEKAVFNLKNNEREVKLRDRQLELLKANIAAKRGRIDRLEDSPEFYQIQVAEVLLEQAKALENNMSDVEYAKAAWTVAIADTERKKAMNEQAPNTISEQEMLETKLRKVQAQKQYERAIYDLKIIRPAETQIREQELEIAKLRLVPSFVKNRTAPWRKTYTIQLWPESTEGRPNF